MDSLGSLFLNISSILKNISTKDSVYLKYECERWLCLFVKLHLILKMQTQILSISSENTHTEREKNRQTT